MFFVHQKEDVEMISHFHILFNCQKQSSIVISRVMYQVVIYLGRMLPYVSINLPGNWRAAICFLFGLSSDGVYNAVSVTRSAVVSYTALSPLPADAGGLLSVTLSCASPQPAVSRHPALWSPDFPLPAGFPHTGSDHIRYSSLDCTIKS